jgi:hypothetical protein
MGAKTNLSSYTISRRPATSVGGYSSGRFISASTCSASVESVVAAGFAEVEEVALSAEVMDARGGADVSVVLVVL